MKIIFCSSVYNMNLYQDYRTRSRCSLSLSDNNLMYSFIRGLEENIGTPITLINNPPIPSYPLFDTIFFYKRFWKHNEQSEDIDCSFINLPVLKQITRYFTTYSHLTKELRNIDDNIFIITYDIHVDICMAIMKIKKYNPSIHTTVILPDIPSVRYDTIDRKKSLYRKKYIQLQMYFIDRFDSYVFITEYMKEFINDIHKKNFVVIEGISECSNTVNNHIGFNDEHKRIILYSGLLSYKYGILDLISAVDKLNINSNMLYELRICGDGEMTQHIKKIACEKNYIKFYGYVNKEEVEKLQIEATVLVNPRRNEGELMRLSFPSKIITYLSTGKPVIAYKLDGMPDDYDDFIDFVISTGNHVDDLARTIENVCSLPLEYRKTRGERAKKFIETEKSARRMCSKIINMWNNM